MMSLMSPEKRLLSCDILTSVHSMQFWSRTELRVAVALPWMHGCLKDKGREVEGCSPCIQCSRVRNFESRGCLILHRLRMYRLQKQDVLHRMMPQSASRPPPASPSSRAPGRRPNTDQNLSVSSPAPVTTVRPSGLIAKYNTR